MFRTAISVLFFMNVLLSFSHGVGLVHRIDQTSSPLVVRSQRAQQILRMWGMESDEFAGLFILNQADDVAEVHNTFDRLYQKQKDFTTTSQLSSPLIHYAVWTTCRAEMLDGVDFSNNTLRHFQELNPTRYPCDPVASISEFTIPDVYINSVGTSAILKEATRRLRNQEDFARVSYNLTSRFERPTTGYKGEVTKAVVGSERFQLYSRICNNYKNTGQVGSAEITGGPYKVSDGYLFARVHKLLSPDNCFGYYREQIVTDYAREWLKKIYNDTLTTTARDLHPQIYEYTSGSTLNDTAFIVADQAVTFAQCRKMFPFLLGNEKSPAFWKSIQRQALEVELIYYSKTGQHARNMPEFGDLKNMLLLIRDANTRESGELSEKLTTASTRRWFDKNRKRFIQPSQLSYTLYTCAEATGDNPMSSVECSAALEKLRTSGTRTMLTDNIAKDIQTSQTWVSRTREVQVACQSLMQGEWSEVFTVDGKPEVLYLSQIDRPEPRFEDVEKNAAAVYENELRVNYWRTFAGLDASSSE